MDVTGFIIDHMGHFTVYDLPGAAFSLVMAALLTALLCMVAGGGARAEMRELVIWSTSSALALVLIRGQLPVAVAILALAILARPRGEGPSRSAMFFAALVIGAGCGSGAALVTAILVLPFGAIARWAEGRS